ncbi:MAG: TonB-dependent receptor [Gammaproteobacteria bacterium]|nr:TonB-dependent receptor [Gammaproteobacteria bacterium]
MLLVLALALLGSAPALAASGDASHNPDAEESEDSSAGPALAVVSVTATRIPEPVDRIPATISVVSGEELRARDARDMASALSLVSGVEAPAGGDAGPSSAVPSFWGLHEFDAFLLVMDDVPWGGAFNPAITTLDLNDVQRIEVLKGSAPVMYGATSFVGVVHVLHYPAGQATDTADIALGSYGSARGSAAFALPQWGSYQQSFAAQGESLGFADDREKVSDGRLLYRGALNLGPGRLSIDANLSIVRDVPPSPVIREGTALTTLTPINANFNPADAALNEDKYQLAIGYSLPTAWGTWDTLASLSRSHVDDVRAFLHADLSGAADTQNQNRTILDDYFDTHLASRFGSATLLLGADLLYGYGEQTTLNGNSAYTVPLDGSVVPPPTSALPVNEIGYVSDKRLFAGQYAQVDWKPAARWDVTAGVRLNETYESKFSSDQTLPPFTPTQEYDAQQASRDVVRPTGTLGVSYQLWRAGVNEAVLYADYRDAYKPSALDFGPDYQPAVLLPETAKSYEVGLKGAAADGRLSFQAELFRLDFNNLVVPTDSGFLTNAAASQLRGAELETRWSVTDDLVLAANYAWHDAHFTQYQFFDADANAYVEVAGKQLPLSPRHLASAGVLYTPQHGLNSTLVATYVGRRFLDEENTAPAGGYTRLDATLGYSFGHYALSLEGTNLTDRRPPVSASEFGSESFYLLNARALWVRLAYHAR